MKAAAHALCWLLLASHGAGAETACPAIAIRFNEVGVTPAERDKLEQELRTGAAKVCNWWGNTFAGPLTVDVNETIPTAMSLVPGWRGKPNYIVFPASTVRSGRVASIHELVHHFAPNGNRFLAEGLAVHAHVRLGGPAAFPNFGKPLPALAAPHAENADIAALDRLATPNFFGPDSTPNRRASYLVAGSFVTFVIAEHGLGKFRQLYATTPFVPGKRNAGEPGRWREVYGIELGEMAAAWRARLSKPR